MPSAIVSPDVDERPQPDETPRRLADRLAREKLAAGVRLAGDEAALVLAADTVVHAGNRILPKTDDETVARACLGLLSGRRHRVVTSVALRAPGVGARVRSAESVVGFARLTTAQIDAYLATGEWRGKAGGYAIQGAAAAFVRFVSGSYSGVVGLPLFETAQLLRGAGWPVP